MATQPEAMVDTVPAALTSAMVHMLVAIEPFHRQVRLAAAAVIVAQQSTSRVTVVLAVPAALYVLEMFPI